MPPPAWLLESKARPRPAATRDEEQPAKRRSGETLNKTIASSSAAKEVSSRNTFNQNIASSSAHSDEFKQMIANPDRLPYGHPRRSTLTIENYILATSSDSFKNDGIPKGAGQNAGVALLASGFCIIENVLSENACMQMLGTCTNILDEILVIDEKHHGNRGKGRYSLGAVSASGQQLHNTNWAWLLSDPVLDALDSIYGKEGYTLKGGGGEVVLGKIDEYQDLHADITQQPNQYDKLERPPLVVINFAIHGIDETHGPTRLLPARGRPRDQTRPPFLDDEQNDSLTSCLAPLPRGSCIVRDARIWHGGTPNDKAYPRFFAKPRIHVQRICELHQQYE